MPPFHSTVYRISSAYVLVPLPSHISNPGFSFQTMVGAGKHRLALDKKRDRPYYMDVQPNFDYLSKISFDDITNWVTRLVATKQGWRYQIRRSWKVRHLPVSETTKFDYEWKIYPSLEQSSRAWTGTTSDQIHDSSAMGEIVGPEQWEGLYFVFSLRADGFVLEHSNYRASGGPTVYVETTTRIPFTGISNWGQEATSEDDPHQVVKSLSYLCSKFQPNFYCLT